MCKPDVEIWKPDSLLEFKVISADQEKCLYQFYRQCPTSLNKGTLFNMSPLFSYFPKSFDFSVFSCLCLGDFWKTSALPQHCQNHCTLLFDFSNVISTSFIHSLQLWNIFKILIISPLETTLPPPNSLSHDSSFTTLVHRITVLAFTLLANHNLK